MTLQRKVRAAFIAANLSIFSLWPASAVAADSEPAAQTAAMSQGEYLARLGNCSSCHTAADGKPYAGDVSFKTPFGIFYSPNITPDRKYGIGGWSAEEFRRAMREGVRPDGSHLYPVFPYTHYAKLTDTDLDHLFSYFMALAPVSSAPRAHELNFPFSINALVGIWKQLFLEEGVIEPDPNSSEAWNRGAYLVEGLMHCSMCHSPRNMLGGEDRDLAYTGGTYFSAGRDGRVRLWSATNLTGHKTGLGAWSKEELMDYLSTGRSSRAVSFGPMNAVIMESTRYLTESDLAAVATYLEQLEHKAQEAGPAPDSELMAEGRRQFTRHCGTCHLPTGLGGASLGVPLVGSSVVQAPDPSTLINVILLGPEVPPSPFESGRDDMPAFGHKLTDDEISAVATYVRNTWGNKMGAVTSEQVAEQR